jgi:hypothetical protein
MHAIAVTVYSPVDAARQRVRALPNCNPPSSRAMSVPSSTGMSRALTVGRARVILRRADLPLEIVASDFSSIPEGGNDDPCTCLGVGESLMVV